MQFRKFNWPLWAGLLLTLFAFFSFFSIFVRFPLTRDFPWANLLLFVASAALLLVGLRRAFAADRRHPMLSKITGGVVTAFCLAVFALFIFVFFISARQLPVSQAAPQVGRKAPDFTLVDASGKPVSLAELRSEPIAGKPAKGTLLIFYRGYW
jgi:hypothetical protein